MKTLTKALEEEQGQGYVEYVVLLSLIALVAWAGVQLLGVNLLGAYQESVNILVNMW